ncbi:hypothetical protein [Caproiciproducens galactitolivorans]|uniref:Uncharacterized protein n=1 Tax=Caproiciproducens galactitolivorans TaxID=642589 RepID=A0ABT4BPP2_9FIRM|nr:hypothetical protein [Caproiciproducens galactitolivorans]MCY1712848.1 hypothetical protein [Caproiciproducens galactitolivorans]
MEKKNELLTLDSITYIDSAEGMARRVLNDLEKCGLSKKELARAYKTGLQCGGFDYPNLIRLGELLQEIIKLSAHC